MTLSFIRARLPAVLVAVMLLSGPGALAAPTCQDEDGLTIRCGTEGAMPVGWTLPFEERTVRPPAPSVSHLVALVATLSLLFALIALLPEFDGRHSDDWDTQEDDG